MNDEKNDFIDNELTALIKRVNPDVVKLEYECDLGEEFCIIHFNNGYEKRACITCDSLSATTRDVLKVCE